MFVRFTELGNGVVLDVYWNIWILLVLDLFNRPIVCKLCERKKYIDRYRIREVGISSFLTCFFCLFVVVFGGGGGGDGGGVGLPPL